MNNWIQIISFTQPHEAHIAKGALEAAGIETLIHDEITAQVNNFYSNAIGGVKLLVNEKDYNEAITVLKSGSYIIEDKTENQLKIETFYIKSKSEKKNCPYCKSENFGLARKAKLASAIGLLLFNGFLPLFKSYHHCFDCNRKWVFKIKK